SRHTVKAHRAQVMERMPATLLAELVHIADGRGPAQVVRWAQAAANCAVRAASLRGTAPLQARVASFTRFASGLKAVYVRETDPDSWTHSAADYSRLARG